MQRPFGTSNGSSEVKSQGVPYLNPDPCRRWIGPRSWGEAIRDGEVLTCLLDNGAQLNFVTPTYARKWGMNVFPLECLTEEVGDTILPIQGMSGILVKPTWFVILRLQVPCVTGYDEDQVVIVLDNPGMKECPVILGMPTLYQVMEVIKESKISQLAIPWAVSRVSWLLGRVQAHMGRATWDDMANKAITLTSVDEVVKVSHKFWLPPFGHKVIHSWTWLVLTGCKLNVMTHGLKTRSP